MSPRELPQPRASRLAIVVYALCGVVGAAGLFAAVRDVRHAVEEQPQPVVTVFEHVEEALDPRSMIGVWRGEGSAYVVFSSDFSGVSCDSVFPRSFTWRVEGKDVVVGEQHAQVAGSTLSIASSSFVAVEGGVQ